ncbi:uncharacterized protein [Medicago truncatula]|uniref:uncharacterized protein n=1 Tax=Medicago truncatula TaxID=3880 RepID=UPI000D2F19D0|nr:uncharacterized protein LOC11418185 [Medicago truncatula]
MQAEDGAKEEMHKSVEKEENKTAEDAQQPPLLQSENESVLQRDRTSKQNDRSNATGYLAIVPTRKQGAFDFLRKLFTTFQNLHCTCGKPINKQPKNLDSDGQGNNAQNGVFVRENGSLFLVSDDLKIVTDSLLSSVQMLIESWYPDLTQLEEVTHNIGKNEILNLLKYALTSREPLTNTILATSSKSNKKDNPPSQFASAVRALPCPSNRSKMDIKVLQTKSQKKTIIAEANEDFVDFIFSFLTMPLGSIVKLLGPNSFAGCVGNLYKSVENLDPTSVLLNPGVAHQFGCLNQPLNISEGQPPHTRYYYGTGIPNKEYSCTHFGNYETREGMIEGGVISKSRGSIYRPKSLYQLYPRSVNGSEDVIGFVKRATLYGIGDDLNVKPLSANSLLSYLKVLSLPLDDLEVKVSIGEAEALSFLGAFLTSRFTLTSGLKRPFECA